MRGPFWDLAAHACCAPEHNPTRRTNANESPSAGSGFHPAVLLMRHWSVLRCTAQCASEMPCNMSQHSNGAAVRNVEVRRRATNDKNKHGTCFRLCLLLVLLQLSQARTATGKTTLGCCCAGYRNFLARSRANTLPGRVPEPMSGQVCSHRRLYNRTRYESIHLHGLPKL